MTRFDAAAPMRLSIALLSSDFVISSTPSLRRTRSLFAVMPALAGADRRRGPTPLPNCRVCAAADVMCHVVAAPIDR